MNTCLNLLVIIIILAIIFTCCKKTSARSWNNYGIDIKNSCVCLVITVKYCTLHRLVLCVHDIQPYLFSCGVISVSSYATALLRLYIYIYFPQSVPQNTAHRMNA